MSASTFSARAGCPQQSEWVLARMVIIPDDGKHMLILIRSDGFWKDGCNHKSSGIGSGFDAGDNLQIIRRGPAAARGVIGGFQEEPGIA